MLKLRINPIVAKDLKSIRDYIAEDNEENAAKTIKEIYGKFENLQMFPGMGSDLSKRVSFWTDYKYAIWEDYVIIYKVDNEYVFRTKGDANDAEDWYDIYEEDIIGTVKAKVKYLGYPTIWVNKLVK